MLSVMFRWLWVCSIHRLSNSTNNLNRWEVIQGFWLQPVSTPILWEAHTYILTRTTAEQTYFYGLVAHDLPLAAPLLNRYAKVESLSIAELNEFVISASSQEIDFICMGRSLVSSWRRDVATFLAPTAPRSSNALSQLSPLCIVLILMLLMSRDIGWRCPLQMKLLKVSLFVLVGLW